MTVRRPSWVEIDLAAIRHNMRETRRLAGPHVKIFVVCKGDGYGVGAGMLARTAVEAGADCAACSDLEDLRAIRAAGVTAPVLLYGSTLPADAEALAQLDVIATIHDFDGLTAFSAITRSCTAYVKVDTGFGRLGFTESQWPRAFDALARLRNVRVVGLYCHLGHTENRSKVDEQVTRFRRAAALAREAGLPELDLMVASSRIVIAYPDLAMNAVNPGRMICGILEPPWDTLVDIRPVVRSLKSRLIQLKDVPEGGAIAYAEQPFARATRIAIAPIGFADGYPRFPAGGSALIGGRRVPIVGARATEHTVFDVTDVPDARIGDEVVLLGRQGEEAITGNELAATTGVPLIELIPRIGRMARRVYVG